VLVLSVATGSPAASSGLRAGDVIVRANGTAVATPIAFQRAIQQCRDRSARLDVVRKKRNEKLTLRW
ncbi:MAG TPA: PDZ domain-containing protein, partial [Gemmatimonadaceae bacterium]|nr:PDZ domain-containing protein [Gemmatimonadaceae bacterium]